MIDVTRISHATFDTPDLERQIDYLTQILGLTVIAKERGQAFLGTVTGQQTVTLNEADQAACTAIAFQTDPGTPLKDIARALSESGVTAQGASDPMPGIGEALSFDDPKGTRIHLFAEQSLRDATLEPKGFMPLKLGHLAFKVHDIQAIVAFYQDVLGFQVSDWREDFFVFMRCGSEHHTVNFAVGEHVKMHHVAYEVKDWAEMLRACDWLGRNDHEIIWGPGRHVIGDNIFTYHRDPDGHIIELYCEMARIEDERLKQFAPRPWRHELPYKPGVWGPDTLGNLWGPPAPAGFGK